MVRLTLLGGFEARVGDGEPAVFARKKAQALLAYLALHPERAHPRGKLASLLWGDTGDAEARASLRQSLLALRQTVPGVVLADNDAVRIDASAVDVDVWRFERLAKDETQAARADAARLYRGVLLAGLGAQSSEFEGWLLGQRERLHEIALDVVARVLAEQISAGDAEAAIQTALRLLAIDPAQEPVYRALMRLYARAGRRADALRQYQLCVTALGRELGVEPSAETQRLYAELVRREPDTPIVPAAGPAPALATHEAPLIGRAAERERLARVLDDVRRGHGTLAAIVGEAGIGKTRLVAELAVDAFAAGTRVLLGRAHDAERILAFAPWVDAVRTAALADETTALDSLGATGRAELARIFPDLGDRNAPPLAPSEDYLRPFESFARLLASLATDRPVVVVLEDIHWADEMSVTLLAFLARRLAAASIAFVVTAREEDLVDAPALQRLLDSPAAPVVQIPLRRLTREATTELVAHLVSTRDPGTAARVADAVWTSSEGNAFMIVETVRAHDDSAAAPLALPERVRRMVAARLERLDDRARSLVRVAAVIGRAFDFALLVRAAGIDDMAVADGIEHLVRRRILHAVGERFEFTHERIRDVAYQSLLPPRRRLLHRVIADAIEDLYRDDLRAFDAELARHATEAERWDKAATHLARVARMAMRAGAHALAVDTFEAACRAVEKLATAERDELILDLRVWQARALHLLGRIAEALECLQAEAPRLGRAANARILTHYHAQLASYAVFLGDCRTADAAIEQAMVSATRGGDRVTLGDVLHARSFIAIFANRPVAGLADAVRAIELLEGTRAQYSLGVARYDAAYHLYVLGRLDESLREVGRLRAIGEAIRDGRLEAMAAWGGGLVLVTAGEPQAAIAECTRAFDLAGDAINTTLALGFLGFAHAAAGDIDEAIAILERAVAAAIRTQMVQWEGAFKAFLAEAWLAKGETSRAATLSKDAVTVLERVNYAIFLGRAQRTQGLVASAEGTVPEARHYLELSRRTLAAIPAPLECAQTDLALSRLPERRPR